MIELTVKTLDSQNHAFTVPDDTTVKQLKERIAESISFPVESQRLIYCGRVLQDEKNLSEYDVNGKVIHLVQRPPPQATRGNGGQQQRRSHHFRQPRLDGNAMYLGAMAFPADLMDSQGIQMPPSSHSLSNSRLLLARRMLRRAATVLTRLENPGAAAAEGSEPDSPPEEAQPEAGASATASAGTSTSASASASAGATASASAAAEGGSEAEANGDLAQGLPFTGSIAQAAHAATAAAIAAAVSAVQAAGVPNITIVRSGQAGHDVVDVHMEGEEDPAAGEQPEAEQGPALDAAAAAAAAAAQSSSSGQTAAGAPPEAADEEPDAAATAPNDPPPTRSNNEVPRPVVLAELLEELGRVNARLQPFMQQYQSLLEEDPSFAANRAAGQEAQRVFSSVSEIMHLLSHAYHALSDIMCDFQEAPPRALRCRPVLIQHSAVLQAGIPIQAQINVMTNRNAANNNNNISSSTNNNGAPAEQQGAAAAAESEPSDAAGDAPSAPRPAPDAASPAPTVAAADSSTAAPPAGQEQPRGRDSHGATESAFNITPGNVEFFMEVGPGSITIDSLEATVVTSAGGLGSDGLQANVVGGSFPWGAPPPPEFIQNLMQAVAGHMMGGRGGTGGSGGSGSGSGGPGGSSNGAGSGGGSGGSAPTNGNSGSGAAAGAAGSGQNSQARGNTATHPTTATQTRSTSRPHVHLAPATMHSLGSSNFDPFLPCNSHHIRPRTRPSATQAFHQQFPLGMASGGEPPVPGESEVPSAPSEAPPPAQAPAASGQPNVQPQVHSAGASPAAGGTTGSGPTPAAPSQAQAQQAQQVTAGLFNMLSSMLGGMPTGPQGAAVNLSSLFQPPGGSGQRPGSGSAQASAAASMFPGGMAFFNLGGGGGSGRPSSTPSHSSQSQPAQGQSQSQSQSQRQSQSQSQPEQPAGGQDMLTQLLQSLGNVMGADVLNPANGEGSLVDFFLQGEGAHSYQAGSSLFLDFTMTMARHMSFGDIIGLSFGNGEPLNRIRPQLRQFVLETAYEGQAVTPASTARVVERIIREIRPQMHVMQQARLREDVDLVTTTIRYNQIRLPEVLALLVEGSEVAFGPGLVRWFSRYVRELSAIILHCCLDGEQGLEQILRGYVMEVTRGIHPAVQMWTVNTSVAHMQTYVRRQSVPFEEIRTFLVYRVPPVAPPAAPPAPRTVPSEIKTDSSCPGPEPMDTEPSPAEAAAKAPSTAAAATAQAPEAEAVPAAATPTSPTPAPAAVSAHAPASAAPAEPAPGDAPLATSPRREPDTPLPALAMEAESLPDVVLGSEAWHNVLPSDWVPIIARDSQRQRRQGSQPPFSDAYLSGMPSKRRKVVTAAKPQGSTNQIISESMRSALDEAGVRPVAGVETAGEDLELQAAYREQVRAAVQESLAEQADFSAERFPNATKYFK